MTVAQSLLSKERRKKNTVAQRNRHALGIIGASIRLKYWNIQVEIAESLAGLWPSSYTNGNCFLWTSGNWTWCCTLQSLETSWCCRCHDKGVIFVGLLRMQGKVWGFLRIEEILPVDWLCMICPLQHSRDYRHQHHGKKVRQLWCSEECRNVIVCVCMGGVSEVKLITQKYSRPSLVALSTDLVCLMVSSCSFNM